MNCQISTYTLCLRSDQGKVTIRTCNCPIVAMVDHLPPSMHILPMHDSLPIARQRWLEHLNGSNCLRDIMGDPFKVSCKLNISQYFIWFVVDQNGYE